jgi:hypothetical protein
MRINLTLTPQEAAAVDAICRDAKRQGLAIAPAMALHALLSRAIAGQQGVTLPTPSAPATSSHPTKKRKGSK